MKKSRSVEKLLGLYPYDVQALAQKARRLLLLSWRIQKAFSRAAARDTSTFNFTLRQISVVRVSSNSSLLRMRHGGNGTNKLASNKIFQGESRDCVSPIKFFILSGGRHWRSHLNCDVRPTDRLVQMESDVTIVRASEQDVGDIVSILRANRDDPSIFLRSQANVRKNLKDFIVAKDTKGQIIGCAALHQYSPTLGEILSVAVLPEFHGQGIGNRLMENCIQQADVNGIEQLWLATVKPGFFGRFGFNPFSRWKLPASVLIYKLRQVFQQSLSRWLPAILGKFTFMERQSKSNVA